MVPMHVARGRLEEAREIMVHVPPQERAEVQERACIAFGRSALAYGEGSYEEALEWALECASDRGTVGTDHPVFKHGIAAALDAAGALDDPTRVSELFDRIRALKPGQRPPTVAAQLARYDAQVAARERDLDTADRRFRDAAELMREIGTRFWLAIVLLEHGELLAAEETGDAKPLLDEAREIFEGLEAKPWLERLDAVAAPAAA